MKHLVIFEAFPTVYAEPTYANQVFKVRYRQNADLSNKKGNDTAKKPENDLLDKFSQGDVVSGTGVEDKETHKGHVLRIEKDSHGENLAIFIEEDGKEVELLPSTVKMEDEIGNLVPNDVADPTALDKFDPTPGDAFQPSTYEMKNLKGFGDYGQI